jgi:lipoprotein-anchoring transpeptidase ErfK/SrfK
MKPENAITNSVTAAGLAALFFVGSALGEPIPAQQPKPSRRHRVVLVSIPDRQLAVLEDGVVLQTFPVSVGAANSPSPVGEFQIVSRVAHPSYSHHGTVIPAGPDNPLGPRWMGLSIKSYGIHGTNAPRSIGKAASHGCIRLNNRDIVSLFPLLSVGDTVVIRAERDEQIARVFGPQDRGVADHATLAQAHPMPLTNQNHAR